MRTEEQQGLKGYPRTYSVNARTLRALDAISIIPVAVLIAVGCLFLIKRVLHLPVIVGTMSPFVALVMFSLAGLYALFFCNVNHRRVILYENGIAVRSWFSTRKLNRSEILGRRMKKLPWQAGGGSYYVVVPADRTSRELRLPAFLHVDEDFYSWMKAIPVIRNKDSGV